MSLRSALKGFSGELRFEEPMAAHTSLGVGGPAEVMAFPATLSEVVDLVKRSEAAGVSLCPLGSGSNFLVLENGIRGIVLNLARLSACREEAGDRLWAEAGMGYPRLSTRAQERGFSGLEFAVGIPGTVGGAVAMNAGIPGAETKDVLDEVTLVVKGGEVVTLSAESITFGYRSARLPEGVIVGARFRLRPSTPAAVGERVRSLLARRRETQPLSFPNVGSVFTNPPGDYAGRLIEAAGLKGTTRGGAQISERHANFIVNRGGATAKEILELIDLARTSVRDRFGIELVLEVRVMGKA